MSKKQLTKKVKDELVDLVSQGLTIKHALQRLKLTIKPNTVYKEQGTDTEFRKAMQTAYNGFFMALREEYHELSSLSPTEAYPDLDYRDAAEKRRGRLQAIQFDLVKCAPKLTPDWEAVSKVEHSGTVQQGITLVLDNYYTPTIIEHKATDSLDHKTP